jgi:tetratricopeptide (TPR) repeat protein
MADPHTSGPRRSDAPTADDEGRIEQLLVTGLDHYFAGEFDAAINLWTRVLFLDRHHDRARAYIDRARSAQAEQQRISEALVHQGLEAFDRGEVVRARALLSDALDQGASHEVALGVIGRIDRLDQGQRSAAPAAPAGRERVRVKAALVNGPGDDQRRGGQALWWAMAAGIVLVAAIAFVTVTPNGLADWFPVPATTDTPVSATMAPAPVPVPAPTEAYLAQGRALFAGGKLRDAMRALDRVPLGDSLRPDADRLRGDIQRELLAVASAEATSPPAAPSRLPPPPRE